MPNDGATARRLLAVSLLAATSGDAAEFSKGDIVRLTRRETLQFEGKNLVTVPKGGEFVVIQHEGERLFVEYLKDDDSLIAASISAESAAAVLADAGRDLVRAFEAFRDQRHDEARRLFQRAAEDPQQKAMVTALAARVNGALAASAAARASAAPAAKQAFANTLQILRDTASQLAKAGRIDLALPLDEVIDKLGGASAPPSRIDRAELSKRTAAASRTISRVRQTIALRRLFAAAKLLDTALAGDPGNAALKAFQARVRKETERAGEHLENAQRLRFAGQKGVVHALSSLDDGLRLCADHPELLALKKEMLSAFESRTSPQVTPAFLSAAGSSASAREPLAAGRELYTTRCTECHDLEMLDSRSFGGWERIVGSMSRRAGLSAPEQARILDYLAAAVQAVERMPAE